MNSHNQLLFYLSKNPIVKKSKLTKKKIPETLAILASSGFSLDKGELCVPNQALLLKPIALIPIHATIQKNEPAQKNISCRFKKVTYVQHVKFT